MLAVTTAPAPLSIAVMDAQVFRQKAISRAISRMIPRPLRCFQTVLPSSFSFSAAFLADLAVASAVRLALPCFAAAYCRFSARFCCICPLLVLGRRGASGVSYS